MRKDPGGPCTFSVGWRDLLCWTLFAAVFKDELDLVGWAGENRIMRIITDFGTIPDRYAKRAPQSLTRKGRPVVSFPFRLEDVPQEARCLHWMLVDPDSVPVCGFPWIHWSLANLPIEALLALQPEGPEALFWRFPKTSPEICLI